MTSQAAKGKHTRLSDHDLTILAREGRTPEQIGAATGITAIHIQRRLRRLGLGNDGQPVETAPTMARAKVVEWYADGDEEWRGHAVCFTGGHESETWFMRGLEPTAKAICGACPVRARCLDAALRAEDGLSRQYRAGVFGGLNVDERMALGAEAVA